MKQRRLWLLVAAATIALSCEVDLDFHRAGAVEGKACEPATTAPCYDGPDGTEGIGSCRAGAKTCNADGTGYGECMGFIGPQPEACTTTVDENCDGSPSCTGNLAWSKRFGSDADEVVTGVAVDDAGAIFITGTFTGSVDFGGGLLVSAGGGDIFLVKLDPDGNHLWSRRFGDTGSPQIATSIAVDNAGNVLIAGQFSGTLDFFSGATALPSLGDSDIFIAKFDHDGEILWNRWFGNFAENSVTSIATDGSNTVLLNVTSSGLVDFGGGALLSSGGFDVLVASLDFDGGHRWSERFGDAADQHGQGVALTSGGDAVVSASFGGSMVIGSNTLISQGGTDIALARLTPAGDAIWSRGVGDASDQTVSDVAVDGAGSTIAVGSFAGTIDFGGGPLQSAGDHDAFIVKLDTDGNPVWSNRFGDLAPQGADRVTTDGSGNVLMVGHFSGEVDFGGEPLASAGSNDVFLVKLAPDGSHLWSKSFGDVEDQSGADVAVDDGGNVIVVGSFPGAMDFGDGPLLSAGGRDIFVAKLGP